MTLADVSARRCSRAQNKLLPTEKGPIYESDSTEVMLELMTKILKTIVVGIDTRRFLPSKSQNLSNRGQFFWRTISYQHCRQKTNTNHRTCGVLLHFKFIISTRSFGMNSHDVFTVLWCWVSDVIANVHQRWSRFCHPGGRFLWNGISSCKLKEILIRVSSVRELHLPQWHYLWW